LSIQAEISARHLSFVETGRSRPTPGMILRLSQQLEAHSRPLHIGTRTIVLETEVRGDDGKLAAKVLQTQAIL
jgi:acyl-coenzyme A thioesterase PaaI-like protein